MKLAKVKSKILKVRAYQVALLTLGVSLLFGAKPVLAPAIALASYFSWEIVVEDIKTLKVNNLKLFLLFLSGVAMSLAGANLSESWLRPIVFFLIGWGMFQLFEGDIGGGDVRLVTVFAVFLDSIKMLAAISLAATLGWIIGYKLKMQRVPFGALLVVCFWLAFGIVRY